MQNIILFTLSIAFSTILSVKSQDYQSKARFLLGVTRYVVWPENDQSRFFRIGVYGDYSLYRLLSEHCMGKVVSQKNIEVFNITRVEEIALFKPQIIVVAAQHCKPAVFLAIRQKTNGAGILIVGDNEGSIKQGAGMEFKTIEGRLAFDMDLKGIETKGLKVSRHIGTFLNK